MSEREFSILAFFYEEGMEELTPAFLAYRMRLSSQDSAAVLDAMVRAGTLEIDVDTEGNISYRLPSAERERLKRAGHRPQLFGQPDQGSHRGPHPSWHDGNAQSAPPLEGSYHGGQYEGAPYGAPGPTYQRRGPHSAPPQDPRGYDGDAGFGSGPSPVVGDFRPSYDDQDYDTSRPPGYADPRQRQPYPSHGGPGQGGPGPYQGPKPHQGGPQPPQRPVGYHQPHHHQQQHPQGHHPQGQWHGPPPTGAMVPYRHQAPVPYEQVPPSPGLAALLSFLFVGSGQWYNGEIGKGFGMLFGSLFLWMFLLGWIINIWSIIDAYNVAAERRLLTQQQ